MYVDLDKYPDQQPYYKIDVSKVDTSDETCAGNYFHKDNFIIFNLAVGGAFPGIWDANGITALGLDTTPLAVRYLLVGIIANFISGWATEFTTKMVEKQQGVTLSREFKLAK